jgi:two-component system response regulator RstA
MYKGFILMMTAVDDDLDQVAAIEMGVDDYIVKPVELRVLLARLRMLLRRGENVQTIASADAEPKHLQFGQLMLKQNTRDAQLASNCLNLSEGEFDLLWLLASHAEKLMSREALLKALRGIEYDGLDRSIDTTRRRFT